MQWKTSTSRMPLIIRGARQVGKTYSAAHLGKSFDNFIEINFERDHNATIVFEKDLHPDRIIRELAALIRQPIIPGKTLLFFDEIQESENAFKSLRYFYELMPSLHVIAAGSLLDFKIAKIGMPVGRIEELYMHPMSFIEFLSAMDRELLAQEITNHDPTTPMSQALHNLSISLLGEYLAIGGMPAAVRCWRDTKDLFDCSKRLAIISNAYKQDFDKYAKQLQIKYLDLLFDHIPKRLGRKFKYSEVSQDYTKRELAPCLDLLVTAGIVTKVLQSTGQGIPLGFQASHEHFKTIFLDIGLSQTVLSLDLGSWIVDPMSQFINKGELVEAFVGQEILAYSNPFTKASLYYWHREARGSSAEVDYLIQKEDSVIPIEVKSGSGSALQSMKLFLESHPNSPYGIKFSPHNYSIGEKIRTYPLYAIIQAMQNSRSSISKFFDKNS
jgi:predicted AAA+ superfamily ATPase